MTIVNTSIKQLGDYTIDEMSGFSIEQLAGVPLDRQFTPLSNTSRVKGEETWDDNVSTWDSEIRTWDEMGSLISNVSHRNLGSYTFDEIGTFSPDQIGDVAFERQFSPIINTSKP